MRWTFLDPDSPPLTLAEAAGEDRSSAAFLLCALSPSLRSTDGGTEAVVGAVRGLTEGGRRVLLLDLDFQNPTLHAVLGEPRGEGLADVLLFGASIPRVARIPEGEPFLFVSAGAPVAEPSALYGSDRWDTLLDGLQDAGVTVVMAVPEDVDAAQLRGLADRCSQGFVFSAADDHDRIMAAFAGAGAGSGTEVELLEAVEVPDEAEEELISAEGAVLIRHADDPPGAAGGVSAPRPAPTPRSGGRPARSGFGASKGPLVVLFLVLLVVVVLFVLSQMGIITIPGISSGPQAELPVQHALVSLIWSSLTG